MMPLPVFLFWSYVLLVLVFCAWALWPHVREEARAERAAALRAESFELAFADMRGACWQCLTPSGVLELVDCGTRFELLCAPCAHATKSLTAPTRQEKAA